MKIKFLYETKIGDEFIPNGMGDVLLSEYIDSLKSNNLEKNMIEFQTKYNMTFPYVNNHDLIRDDRYETISNSNSIINDYYGDSSQLYLYYIGTGGNLAGGLGEYHPNNFSSYIENIPDSTKKLIRTCKNVFLYICQHQEEISLTTFYKLYTECLLNEIPLDKVFVSSDNFNFEDIYNTLLREYNINLDIKFFNYPWALYQASNLVRYLENQNNIVTDIQYNRNKKLLCFNRYLREHKILAISYLLCNDYESDCYLSFDTNFLPDEVYESCNSILVKRGYDRMMDEKKLVIDYDDLNEGSFIYDDKNLYDSSYFSLVTETIFNGGRITEKTFKPIINKHPFILFAPPKSLEYLKYYNFKTFGEYIDESYDNDIEPTERYQKLFKLIDFIVNKSRDELDVLTMQLSDILIHNKNLLEEYNHSNMLIDFEKNITKIVNNTFTNKFKSIINPKSI